jgi:hypothetical protein
VIVQESKPLLGLKRSSSQSAAAILKAAASLFAGAGRALEKIPEGQLTEARTCDT